ncbi:MAG: Amidohydrolase, partial [Modestobacter sp.]|nr:Amidohydrolase [Modestobacter sp.]
MSMELAPSQGPAASSRVVGGEGVLSLLAAARADADRTVDLRRRLHRQPEIGLHLPATQATVLAAFADLPIEVTTGTSTSSVVGVLRGARPGPTYLLRGDMDALPVHEDTGL